MGRLQRKAPAMRHSVAVKTCLLALALATLMAGRRLLAGYDEPSAITRQFTSADSTLPIAFSTLPQPPPELEPEQYRKQMDAWVARWAPKRLPIALQTTKQNMSPALAATLHWNRVTACCIRTWQS